MKLPSASFRSTTRIFSPFLGKAAGDRARSCMRIFRLGQYHMHQPTQVIARMAQVFHEFNKPWPRFPFARTISWLEFR